MNLARWVAGSLAATSLLTVGVADAAVTIPIRRVVARFAGDRPLSLRVAPLPRAWELHGRPGADGLASYVIRNDPCGTSEVQIGGVYGALTLNGDTLGGSKLRGLLRRYSLRPGPPVHTFRVRRRWTTIDFRRGNATERRPAHELIAPIVNSRVGGAPVLRVTLTASLDSRSRSHVFRFVTLVGQVAVVSPLEVCVAHVRALSEAFLPSVLRDSLIAGRA